MQLAYVGTGGTSLRPYPSAPTGADNSHADLLHNTSARIRYVVRIYLATSSNSKVFGFMGGSSSPLGVTGSNSAMGRKIACVFSSTAMVRAYLRVGTFSTTLY